MTTGRPVFPYLEAVSRNLGWLSEAEQLALRYKKVAVVGAGGVGGVHLATLARLGVQRFHIADFDHYEIANFNRQVGARISTIGRPKVEVMAEDLRAINPECDIKVFDRGVTDSNLEEFLDGVDLFIDGFDFFVIDLRAKAFARCREKGIPAITAAPLGMGTSYLVFTPQGMSFEEYFRLQGLGEYEKYANFLVGLAPRALHRSYLVDPEKLDLAKKRGPSTFMGCELAAGVTGAEAVKLLLGRGPVYAAPYYTHFDAYRGKMVRGKLRWGNAGPLQRLKLRLVHRMVRKALQAPPSSAPLVEPVASEMQAILELGRWAPSGDNVQPWRFRVIDDERLEIRLVDNGERANIYEFDSGRPTWISMGCLLESLRVAASAFGRGFDWRLEGTRVDVTFPRDPDVVAEPEVKVLTMRSVDRRPYRRDPLSREAKDALEAAVGLDYRVIWRESGAERWEMAKLSALATDVRLRLPETFDVHRQMLDWRRPLSPTGIPSAATGLDAPTRKIMRWSMQDWRRVSRMNSMPGSLLPVKAQLDWLPGWSCGAQFAIVRREPGDGGIQDALETGIAFQRFWLTATRLGLVLQPNFAVQCFAFYGGELPTSLEAGKARAGELAARFRAVLGFEPASMAALGRIGTPRGSQSARSVRRPLSELQWTDSEPLAEPAMAAAERQGPERVGASRH